MKAGPDTPRTPAPTSSVQSVERSLQIFEVLAQNDGELGVSDLSAATGLPVGTVHRLVGTLLARGYVRQNARTRRYALGYRIIALINQSRSRGELRAIAQPVMDDLVKLTDETVNLVVLDADRAMFLAQVQPPRTVRAHFELGRRVPLHATSSGKVLLAFLPPERQQTMLARIELFATTARTITDLVRLRAVLSDVQRQGYALDEEELEEGIACVSAPVWDTTGQVVAALGMSAPAARLRPALVADVLPHMQAHAAELSALLGYERAPHAGLRFSPQAH